MSYNELAPPFSNIKYYQRIGGLIKKCILFYTYARYHIITCILKYGGIYMTHTKKIGEYVAAVIGEDIKEKLKLEEAQGVNITAISNNELYVTVNNSSKMQSLSEIEKIRRIGRDIINQLNINIQDDITYESISDKNAISGIGVRVYK